MKIFSIRYWRSRPFTESNCLLKVKVKTNIKISCSVSVPFFDLYPGAEYNESKNRQKIEEIPCFEEWLLPRWNSRISIWQKTWVFCSMLFTVPFIGVFYRKPYPSLFYSRHMKTILTLLIKIRMKKSTKYKNSSLFMNMLFEERKKRKKTWVWEDSSLFPDTSPKNAAQEFHLWNFSSKRRGFSF